MPGAITRNEPLSKKEPLQKSQQEKDVRTELGIGSIVKLENGQDYVVTQIDAEKRRFKGEPVRFQEKWEFDRKRKAEVFTKDQILTVLRESQKEKAENISKEDEKQDKKEKNPKRSHAVSFSVVTNGDTDGLVTSGNSHETIVTGETANGFTFTARSLGSEISRATIESRVESKVESADLNHENEDERKAYDDLQDFVNQPHSIETVEISGGNTVNRDTLGIEESVPEGTEYKKDFLDFDSGIDINRGANPFDQSKSLDEILNDRGGISEDSPLNTMSNDYDVSDDFEDPELSLF